MFSYNLAKVDALIDKTAALGITLDPGESLTVTAQSAASAIVNVTLLMEEPF